MDALPPFCELGGLAQGLGDSPRAFAFEVGAPNKKQEIAKKFGGDPGRHYEEPEPRPPAHRLPGAGPVPGPGPELGRASSNAWYM